MATVQAGSATALGLQRAADETTDRLIITYRTPGLVEGRSAKEVQVAPLASNEVRMSALSSFAATMGLTAKPLRVMLDGSEVVKLSSSIPLQHARALAERIKASSADVAHAEPDVRRRVMGVPNDPLWAKQWSLHSQIEGGINMGDVWTQSTGKGVRVGVIDTGSLPHPDLVSQLIPGYDFTDREVSVDGDGRDANATDPGDFACPIDPRPSTWHGAHVAGIIAAATNNRQGMVGIAPDARVQALRALGRCGGYDSDIADAIRWGAGGMPASHALPAAPNPTPAHVLNLSLGGPGGCPAITQRAIDFALSRNVPVVVAAGNESTNAELVSPANCRGVITVGAVGPRGERSLFSNYGSVVALSAPGGQLDASFTKITSSILSTVNGGVEFADPKAWNYSSQIGTSQATPHVTGVVALIRSVKPELTPRQIRTVLKETARPFPAGCDAGPLRCGAGILDAKAAVTYALTRQVPGPTKATYHEKASSEWDAELNGSFGTAEAVPRVDELAINGAIFTRRDTDFYKLVIPRGSSITASLTQGAMSNFDLIAYDSARAQVGYSNNDAGSPDVITLMNPTDVNATVYLRVRYVAGLRGGRAGAYSIKVLRNE